MENPPQYLDKIDLKCAVLSGAKALSATYTKTNPHLTMATNDEQACVLAALILADDGIAVTEEKIKAVLKAAGVNVEPFWPAMFAKCLSGIDIKDLVSNVGSGAGAAAPAAGGGGAVEPAAEAKEEAKKEESEEESDDDMGFGLFD